MTPQWVIDQCRNFHRITSLVSGLLTGLWWGDLVTSCISACKCIPRPLSCAMGIKSCTKIRSRGAPGDEVIANHSYIVTLTYDENSEILIMFTNTWTHYSSLIKKYVWLYSRVMSHCKNTMVTTNTQLLLSQLHVCSVSIWHCTECVGYSQINWCWHG